MKKIITLLTSIGVGLSALAAEGSEKVVFVAKTTEAGTLREVLGDKIYEIDSLVVEGPIDTQDFYAMGSASSAGRTTGINLAGATAVEGFMPGNSPFYGRIPEKDKVDKLEYLVLPQGVDVVQKQALVGMITLKYVRFTGPVRIIEESVFDGDFSLSDIELPEGLEEIGPHAFYGCRDLRSINMPSTLKVIDEGAFFAASLDEFELPEGLVHIGALAFGNSKKKDLKIPSTCVEFVGTSQLGGMSELTTLDCGGLKIIPESFTGSSLLSEVKFSDNLEHIGRRAFQSCDIKKLKFPVGFRSIEAYAFNGNSELKELLLPSTTEYIGEKAFSGCVNLTTVYCAAIVPPTYVVGEGDADGTFVGEFGQPHFLYVPQGSEEAYRNAPVWGKIHEIVGVPDEDFIDIFGVGGVEAVEAAVSDVKVSAANGEIAVSGGAGEMCEVYTADGRMAASVRLSGDTRVALAQGLYIVKAAGKVCKVRI